MDRTASSCSSASVSVERLIDRVRGEYLEMPGLRLTAPQAQRLFGLDPVACSMVLDTLTRDKFLCRGSDGAVALLR